MSIIVDIAEAAERLEELIDRACAGEDVSISINGIPMVWLKPYTGPLSTPTPVD